MTKRLLFVLLLAVPVLGGATQIINTPGSSNVFIPIVYVDTNGDVVDVGTSDCEIDEWNVGAAPDGFTDATNEATEIGTTNRNYLELETTETDTDYTWVKCTSTTTDSMDVDILLVHTNNPSNPGAGTIVAADLATDTLTADKIAADAIGASEAGFLTDSTGFAGATVGTSTLTQTQVTGGAYALDTDANGRIRIVDGTAAGELDTASGTVALTAATEGQIDAIETDTSTTLDNLVDDLESRLGTPSDLGGGATVAGNLSDIEGQTDDIGAAGAGLTEAGGDGDHLTDVPVQVAQDAGILICTVDSTNGAPTTTTAICDLTDPDGNVITAEDNLLIGKRIELVTSSAPPPRVGDYAWISASTWSGANTELTITFTELPAAPANTDVFRIEGL